MAITNRETLRDKLKDLFAAALVGTNKPMQAFYEYMKGDFGGQSPVGCISSGGSMRTQEAINTREMNVFYFEVYSFTLYVDQAAPTAWDEQKAEDRVDLIEKTIADVLVTNRTLSGFWETIGFENRSKIDFVIVGGEEYKRETFYLKAVCRDN